jgi:hypothetical protein
MDRPREGTPVNNKKRIHVDYTISVTQHEFNELVRIAKERQYDYSGPQTRKLVMVKYLLQSSGTGVLAETAPEKEAK